MTASKAPSRVNSAVALAEIVSTHDDPGTVIVKRLSTLLDDESMSFVDRYNGLSCARKFVSYCVHYGEAKFEFKDYVIFLLPTAFSATVCQRKRLKHQRRAKFALSIHKDESQTIQLEIIPSELPH